MAFVRPYASLGSKEGVVIVKGLVLTVTVLLLAVVACSDPMRCTGSFNPAIRVTVQEFGSGTFVGSAQRLLVLDGHTSDSMIRHGPSGARRSLKGGERRAFSLHRSRPTTKWINQRPRDGGATCKPVIMARPAILGR